MSEVAFTIYGEPASKERPRVTSKGTFTPKRTVDAEKAVRAAYRAAATTSNGEVRKLEGKLQASMVFFNGNRRRRDLDNMVKLVLDALNGIAYDDDVQVHRKLAEKYFTSSDRARTFVLLTETSESFIEGE